MQGTIYGMTLEGKVYIQKVQPVEILYSNLKLNKIIAVLCEQITMISNYGVYTVRFRLNALWLIL